MGGALGRFRMRNGNIVVGTPVVPASLHRVGGPNATSYVIGTPLFPRHLSVEDRVVFWITPEA